MKKQFWKLMLMITVISMVMTIILGSEIPWNDLGSSRFSWPLAKAILYDISTGVFSSMILVWFIDRIQLRETEKLEAKQRLILYNKLNPILSKYYNFYLFLYISTRKMPVETESKVLESLYLCKDELYEQINNTNPFYKDGYLGDPVKFNAQMVLMKESAYNPQVMDQIAKTSTRIPWYKCWGIEGTEFYEGISQIERDFPTFFTNELLEMFEELLQIVKPQKNIIDFVEGNQISKWLEDLGPMPHFPTEFFVYENKIEDILRLLDKIMKYIEDDSSHKLRSRDLKFFNERTVAPTIGDSCDVHI